MQPPASEDDGIQGIDGPIPALDHALEEQEDELIEQLLQRIQEGIPGESTISEAMLMMRRTVLDDPEAHELCCGF
jgi:hypothetical protein